MLVANSRNTQVLETWNFLKWIAFVIYVCIKKGITEIKGTAAEGVFVRVTHHANEVTGNPLVDLLNLYAPKHKPRIADCIH